MEPVEVAVQVLAMVGRLAMVAAGAEHQRALAAARLAMAAVVEALAASAGTKAGRMATPCCTSPAPSMHRPVHSSP